MSYTKEQLLEAYRRLPEDVKEAIFSVQTADVLRQLGDGKPMMIDHVGELAAETGLVLLGFTHPSQFVSHLAERLGIEKSVAKEIAEEVNTKIFFPVRENLKKIHGLRENEEEIKIPPAPTSIFEAKTKEGVFRAPAEITEKKEETKKIDPYREPAI